MFRCVWMLLCILLQMLLQQVLQNKREYWNILEPWFKLADLFVGNRPLDKIFGKYISFFDKILWIVKKLGSQNSKQRLLLACEKAASLIRKWG